MEVAEIGYMTRYTIEITTSLDRYTAKGNIIVQ